MTRPDDELPWEEYVARRTRRRQHVVVSQSVAASRWAHSQAASAPENTDSAAVSADLPRPPTGGTTE